MKGSDKAIVLGVIMAVVLLGFYVKVLSPKREKASSLSKDITTLQTQVDQQKQAAMFGEDARQHFPAYYGRLVVMGKAVPADADTGSLLVQLNSVANRTHVKFSGLQLGAGSSSGTATSSTPPPAPPPSSGTSGTSTGTTSTGTTSTTPSSTPASATTSPTAATEATAANLPLGAAVGPAGLPVMPYDLTFEGSYFNVANFLKGLDDLVHTRGTDQIAADGRLLTIDAFSLTPPDASNGPNPNPQLKVALSVTSYVTPPDQGLTAGAAPAGPSLSQPQTQPASATVAP